MILDTLYARELLRVNGIRVARARYVDGPEDATAFAEGHPILVRLVVGGRTAEAEGTERVVAGDAEIRDAYARVRARADAFANGRVLAQRALGPGTDITLECRDDPSLGRIVEIACGAHRAHRLAPTGSFGAESMLAEFGAKHGIASTKKAARMLAHLIERACNVFSDEAIERISLDPVRLHDNAYDCVDAIIEARRPVRVHRRTARRTPEREPDRR